MSDRNSNVMIQLPRSRFPHSVMFVALHGSQFTATNASEAYYETASPEKSHLLRAIETHLPQSRYISIYIEY